MAPISHSREKVIVVGKSPCGQVDLLLRARLLTLKTEDAYHGFLLDLDKLMCAEEGEKKYLLPVIVPPQSELRSNLSLLDKLCRQTKVQPLPTLLILF